MRGIPPVPSITLPASLSRACRPTAAACRRGRAGSMRSNTTTSGPSVAGTVTACACFRVGALTTPTERRRSRRHSWRSKSDRRDPWDTRRATLTSLLRRSVDGMRLCEHIEGTDGLTIFGHARGMGLEGMWRSGGTGRIGLGGRRTGSRSRTRLRRLRCG
jgi:hypothetical protein